MSHLGRRIINLCFAFVIAVMSVNISGVLTLATAHAASPTPAANPALSQACGLDIALVIDNSDSISSSEMSTMKSALQSFTNALSGTPTQFSVTRFGTNASVVSGFTSNVATTNTAITSVTTGGGGTNWEDGLLKAKSTFDPRADKPNLVIFASDGNPTYHIGGGNGFWTSQADIDAAVTQANSIKTGGTRILALGIGSGLDIDNLKAISGPNANTGNVLTSDVISSDFANLAAGLATFAQQTCGATITTKKIIDVDGNVNTTNDQTVASGWTFDINGGSNPNAETTDATGLTPAVKVTPGSGYSVNEVVQSGYSLVSANCTGATNNGGKNGNAVTGIQVAAGSIVSCTFINTPNKGSITIVKDAQPNDAQDFNFTATGSGVSNFSLDDDSDNTLSNTKVFNNLVAGQYTFTEAATAGWSLKNIVCPNGAVTVNGSTVTVNLAAGQNLTCTFTNEKQAKLTIKKITNPASSTQVFNFTTTGSGLSSFNLDTAAGGNPDSKQFTSLTPGAYSVTEGAVLDGNQQPLWDLTDLTCGGKVFTKNGNTLGVTLAAGDDVTCTFTNTQRGSISGTKYLVNADGSHVGTLSNWTIFLQQGGNTISTTTDANGNYSFNNVLAGLSYLIFEGNQTGYTQISPASNYNFTLGAGQNKTGQNFGNFQNGSISGYKWNDLNGNGKHDDNEPKLSNWTIQLKQDGTVKATTTTDANGNYGFTNLQPGTYDICEVQQSGWTQITPANNGCYTITIDTSGESNADKNFGNQGQSTIQVKKNVDDGFGTISENVTDWNWHIGQSSAYPTGSSQSVPAGSYTINEDQKADYHFSSLSCTLNGRSVEVTQAESATIIVGAGDAIVCTYLNTRDTGTLKVVKNVINDNGGTKTYEDFSFNVDSSNAQSFDADVSDPNNEDGVKTMTIATGTYTVTEVNANSYGYVTSYDNCADIVVTKNQTATCVITNNDTPKTVTAVPATIRTDVCGTANDTYTIPATTGVVYKVNGVIKPAGNYQTDTNITVTAEAANSGYTLTGETSWTLTFNRDSCAHITATAVCDLGGVTVTLKNDGDTDGSAWVNGKQVSVPGKSSVSVTAPLTLWKASVSVYDNDESQLLVKDFDCTPGRGNVGGETPTELPRTGADAGDTLAKLVTIFVAGITTYGAMFFIINRRESLKK